RTPCGKPAAYTAEKHRSQSGRQLAKTQPICWPHPVHMPMCWPGSPHTPAPQAGHAPNKVFALADSSVRRIRSATVLMSSAHECLCSIKN
ncbi:hypothetical protein, partial [Bifidobacterium longum]